MVYRSSVIVRPTSLHWKLVQYCLPQLYDYEFGKGGIVAPPFRTFRSSSSFKGS
jgi:hypothetical protein